ncbi:MAG: hypothetical protein QOE09_2389 [Ilumatobacteraceae bacterium]|jgi:hypothetical protein
MRLHSILKQHTRPVRADRDKDEGSTLILALVVIIIGAFFVLPTMTYIMTVNQASRLRIEGANSSEVVRGGLRAVLYDPAALYSACSNSGATDPSAVNLAVPPGLAITTKCTTTANSQQFVSTDLRWSLSTTMVGASSVIPPNEADGSISRQWCTTFPATIPCGFPYPGNASAVSTDWSGTGMGTPPDTGQTTPASTGSKIFLPYVPSVIDAAGFAGGYNVDLGGGQFCKVYFPGRYTDDVVITGTTPVYFVSGVYYFEKALRFSGDAKVVVGAGATDGCVDGDAVAVADAGYADATSNGVGGTFVFGAQGRMIIDTLTPSTLGRGVSVIFNRRLVDPLDPDVIMNNVSIMSVNGVTTTSTANYDNPGIMHVPASKVFANPLVDPFNQNFMASTLIPTTVPAAAIPCAPPPAAPTASCPIVDVNLTTTMPVNLTIPGYVSVPQGAMSINTLAGMTTNKKISFGGGILTGTIAVSAVKPATLQVGLLNSVVQKTFKIVSVTTNSSPRVTATALVQVNQTGGFAVNSWVTSIG